MTNPHQVVVIQKDGQHSVCGRDCCCMTVLHREARRPLDPPANDGFEVSYVPDDGAKHRVPLAQAWAVPLERSSS